MIERVRKINYGKLLKIALGSALAIIVSNLLGLAYSPSAGIITLLTIQNTKRETIVIAGKRFFAFLLALLLAGICFYLLGYTPLGFGLFLFLFVLSSELVQLQDGISMNAVLTTHFLIEQQMTWALIQNELLLLFIGMGIGIALNLIMRTGTKQIKQQVAALDEKMKEQLLQLALMMRRQQTALDLDGMQSILNKAMAAAHTDRNNQLVADYTYFVKYCLMRKAQVDILISMKQILPLITKELPQAMIIADFIQEIAYSYQESNEMEELLLRYQQVLRHFQCSDLPATREEFENRAYLFQVLTLLKQFLYVKRQFVEQLSKEERSHFWGL